MARPFVIARLAHPSLILFGVLLLLAGCSRNNKQSQPDHPRLTSQVAMQDIIFHSTSLNRDMQYRVILPVSTTTSQKLPVVYLLHGRGGNFRDWSNYSDVAGFAVNGLILVMPEGDDSYYTNSAEHTQDRYEDYIVKDLIADVEARFPAARQNRAIIGVSMGGFGAVKLALAHPELFAFAAGLSSAVDVPGRPFSWNRLRQWWFFRSIFGPWRSQTRRDSDPFILARTADPVRIPYLFLACGEQEALLSPNREFADLLKRRHFAYEFHTTHGGHDWNQWNGWLVRTFQCLHEHIGRAN
jgi:putative tributyrin esterase